MVIAKETKQGVIQKFKKGPKDTGSAEVQIALLTSRIEALTGHLKAHTKDHHSRYGLIKLVSQRKRHLAYLARVSPKGYEQILEKLNLRK